MDAVQFHKHIVHFDNSTRYILLHLGSVEELGLYVFSTHMKMTVESMLGERPFRDECGGCGLTTDNI
jgi:hypothetical protein